MHADDSLMQQTAEAAGASAKYDEAPDGVKQRFEQEFAGLDLIGDVESVTDVLGWVKQAMNATAFAKAAALLTGPGDAMPYHDSMLSQALGYDQNRQKTPGAYDAYRKVLDQQFPWMSATEKVYLIDLAMHPEKYRQSNQSEDDESIGDQIWGAVKKIGKDVKDVVVEQVDGIWQDVRKNPLKALNPLANQPIWALKKVMQFASDPEAALREAKKDLEAIGQTVEGLYEEAKNDPSKFVARVTVYTVEAIVLKKVSPGAMAGNGARAATSTKVASQAKGPASKLPASSANKKLTDSPLDQKNGKKPTQLSPKDEAKFKREDTRNPYAPCTDACFLPETHLFIDRETSKPIIEFRSYAEFGDDCDSIITRDEKDPGGPLTMRRVLRKFVRTAPILNIHVDGHIIGTTAEHPFHVEGKGWIPAFGLEIGDVLSDFEGASRVVEGVARSGRTTTVINIEVEECHTYFVGEPGWGWAIWAHNASKWYRGPCDDEKGIPNRHQEKQQQKQKQREREEYRNRGENDEGSRSEQRRQRAQDRERSDRRSERAEGSAAEPRGMTEQHHSDLVSLGGDPNQKTTTMSKRRHRGKGDSFHNELGDHLRAKHDEFGRHMRPVRGNSGEKVRKNFDRDELIEAQAQFYRMNRQRWPEAAKDFFKQHPKFE